MKRQRTGSPQRYHHTTSYQRESNDSSKRPYSKQPTAAEVDDLVSQLRSGPSTNGSREASRDSDRKDSPRGPQRETPRDDKHDRNASTSTSHNPSTSKSRPNPLPTRPNNTTKTSTSTSISTSPAISVILNDLDTRLKAIETNDICSIKYAGRVQSTVDNMANLKQTVTQWEESGGPPRVVKDMQRLKSRMDAIEARDERMEENQNKQLKQLQDQLDVISETKDKQALSDQGELAAQVAMLSARFDEQASELEQLRAHTKELEMELVKVREDKEREGVKVRKGEQRELSDEALRDAILGHVIDAAVNDPALSMAINQSVASLSVGILRNKNATVQLGQLVGTIEGEIEALRKRLDERIPSNVNLGAISADMAIIKDTQNGQALLLNQLRPIIQPQILHNVITTSIQHVFTEYTRKIEPVIEKNLKDMVVKLRQEFAPQVLSLAKALEQQQQQQRRQQEDNQLNANFDIPGQVPSVETEQIKTVKQTKNQTLAASRQGKNGKQGQ